MKSFVSFLIFLLFSSSKTSVTCVNLTSSGNVTLGNVTVTEIDEWNLNVNSSAATYDWLPLDDVNVATTTPPRNITSITSANMTLNEENSTALEFPAVTYTTTNMDANDNSSAEISTFLTVLTTKTTELPLNINVTTTSTDNFNNITQNLGKSSAKMVEKEETNSSLANGTFLIPATSPVNFKSNGTFLNNNHNSSGEDSTFSLISTTKSTHITSSINYTTTLAYNNLNNFTRILSESTAKSSQEPNGTFLNGATSQGSVSAMNSNGRFSNWTWFVLSLEGNCSVISRGRPSQGEKSFKNQLFLSVLHQLGIDNRSDLSVSDIKCVGSDRIQVNFSVSASLTNLSQLLDEMEALNQPLLRMHDVDLYVYEIELWDGEFLSKEPEVDAKHTDVEMVVYIAVGSSCAFMLCLAAILLAGKYCCHENSKASFDTSSASHAMGVSNVNTNMRLEDYTLTRIPRPKFGYVDYYRNKRYCQLDERMVATSGAASGMVQPYDTSLVPLEDAYSSAPVSDGVIIKPTNANGRRFGGSLSRIYCNDEAGRSNEYLHNAKVNERQDGGLDNPNFH